jgi:hypothetical protein
MANGIVFKQWYKPRNIAGTRLLNKKHLIYIATRPGTVYNKDCGFGLWGKIANMQAAETINDFELAKKTAMDVSQNNKTIYRCILSLEAEDAKKHGYQSRDTWQDLITHKINIIAKEMDIKPENINWMASFHCKSNPHVHIMYWDNSSEIRTEGFSKEHFEIAAEHIRAGFNKEVFKNEIFAFKLLKDEQLKQLRSEFKNQLASFNSMKFFDDETLEDTINELNANVDSFNDAEMMNFKGISRKLMLEIADKLQAVADVIPAHGALKYKYLSNDAKAVVDSLTDCLFNTNSFAGELKKYLNAVDDLSEQYGNGESTVQHNRSKAYKNLYYDMGNEILMYIKNNNLYSSNAKNTIADTRKNLTTEITKYIRENISVKNQDYRSFIKLIPERVTPYKIFMDSEFNRRLDLLCSNVLNDKKIRILLKTHLAYIEKAVSAEQKNAKTEKLNELKDIKEQIRSEILSKAFEEKNWPEQRKHMAAANLLINMFSFFSAKTNRQNAKARQAAKAFSKDMSKQAKKEYAIAHKSVGLEWE